MTARQLVSAPPVAVLHLRWLGLQVLNRGHEAFVTRKIEHNPILIWGSSYLLVLVPALEHESKSKPDLLVPGEQAVLGHDNNLQA